MTSMFSLGVVVDGGNLTDIACLIFHPGFSQSMPKGTLVCDLTRPCHQGIKGRLVRDIGKLSVINYL